MAFLPRTVQAPPELPNMPNVSSMLTNYLHSFSLWTRHGFADKLSTSTAAPGIMLLASDPAPGVTPKAFMLQVTTAGAVVVTPVPLGEGKP